MEEGNETKDEAPDELLKEVTADDASDHDLGKPDKKYKPEPLKEIEINVQRMVLLVPTNKMELKVEDDRGSQLTAYDNSVKLTRTSLTLTTTRSWRRRMLLMMTPTMAWTWS